MKIMILIKMTLNVLVTLLNNQIVKIVCQILKVQIAVSVRLGILKSLLAKIVKTLKIAANTVQHVVKCMIADKMPVNDE